MALYIFFVIKIIANNLNVYDITYVFDTLPTINKNEEDDLRKLLPYSKHLSIKLKVTK